MTYKRTSPAMSMKDLDQAIAAPSSVDLVTTAQAIHWFDRSTFYWQAKHMLKKPHGVIAAWCYQMLPKVNNTTDELLHHFYTVRCGPFWEEARKLVNDKYATIEFPFEPVEGEDHTGPFEFVAEKVMDLEHLVQYIRSWSAYQKAKEKGVELLGNDVIDEFRSAWDENDEAELVAKFCLFEDW